MRSTYQKNPAIGTDIPSDSALVLKTAAEVSFSTTCCVLSNLLRLPRAIIGGVAGGAVGGGAGWGIAALAGADTTIQIIAGVSGLFAVGTAGFVAGCCASCTCDSCCNNGYESIPKSRM